MTTHHYSYPQYKINEHCKKCYKITDSQHLLKQEICGSTYCPRCICQIYQPHYISQQPDIIIELYCSHYINKEVIQQFVKEYCINCGNKCDMKVDLEMKDKIKLCRSCFNYCANKYRDLLFECMSCNRIIRNINFIADAEIVLCRDCAVTQSSLQSSIASEKITNEHTKYNESKNINQPSQISQLSFKKKESKKKKEEESDEPEEDISIVSRFSAFEISEDDPKEGGKIKLTSKHSVQIKVENLKLKVTPNPDPRTHCDSCNCLISDQGVITKDINQTKAKQCRVCFMENFDPRETGFYKSFAKTSPDNERYKHTSAPKNKILDKPAENVRTMKKSHVFQGNESTATNNTAYSLFDVKKITQSVATKPPLEPWQKAQIDSDKLCQVCKQKRYIVIRVDKKKVCLSCHSQK